MHILVLFSFGLLMQFHAIIPQERKVENLQVRLVQLLPPKVQTKPAKQLLSTNARAAQQDAARTYYLQAMEAQAKQRSEMQAQLMIKQLQQMLAKRLDVEPLVTGKCILVETDSGVSTRLKCDSSALYEVIYKDLKDVAEMLIVLRGTGRMFNGFTAEIRKDKPAITLISQELSTNSNKETLQPTLP